MAKSRAYQTDVAHAPATVEIQPYQDIAGKIAPDRASGRLKARFLLTVRNRANAPTEVLLNAEDADGECQFRFAQPSITVDPGRGIEAPFTVFPNKQSWIGRPKDRSIRVTATPAGAEQPPPPIPAVYRQRAWLPWWLSVVAPIVAVLIALFILLAPKQTVVPNLKVARSVFAAQKLLTTAGLKLSLPVGTKTVAGAAAGSIVDQTPAAGKKVKRGTAVTIEVATASSTLKVPNVVGLTPQTADTTLRLSGLVLGAVAPTPNPNGKIGSQIPAAQVAVGAGTPVNVYLQPPAPAGKPATKGSSTHGTSGTSGSKSGAAGAKPVVIPAVGGAVAAAVAAQTLSQKGLVPTEVRVFNAAPAGTLLGTSPAAGKSLAPGSHIALLVSAGFPQLAYDDGNNIHIVSGATSKASAVVPASPPQVEPSWSIDGSQVVYVQGGGQLMLDAPNQKGAQPFVLTAPGADDHVPSFAPTTTAKIVAFVSGGGQNKLCFATIGPNHINPDCTSHPGWSLGRQVAWSPDGTTILVFGSELGHGNTVFGLIEFLSNVPFSTHASDWGQGTVVTNTSTPKQGVIAGAFSPDGKKVALVANFGTDIFHVVLAPSNDFALAHAEVLPVRACQVSWRSDGNQLAVMQADSACQMSVGDIVAVNPAAPDTSTTIATQAEYPAWQPLSLGG
jgi:beta-lactam-binding protein with PASTA domain